MIVERINEQDGIATLNNRDNFALHVLRQIRNNIVEGHGISNGQLLYNGYITSIYLYEAINVIGNIILSIEIFADKKSEDVTFKNITTEPEVNKTLQDINATLYAILACDMVYGEVLVYQCPNHAIITFDNDAWIADAQLGFKIDVKNLFEKKDYPEYIKKEDAIFIPSNYPIGDPVGIVQITLETLLANQIASKGFVDIFKSDFTIRLIKEMWEPERPLKEYDIDKYTGMFEMMWLGYVGEHRPFNEFNIGLINHVSQYVGIDKELIMQPDGISKERWTGLTKRALQDSVRPLLSRFLHSLSRGLDFDSDQDIRLHPDVAGYVFKLDQDLDRNS